MIIYLTPKQLTIIRQALNQASAENRTNASEARGIDDYDFARGFDRQADLQNTMVKFLNTQEERNA